MYLYNPALSSKRLLILDLENYMEHALDALYLHIYTNP
jgi:hypothetical protein